MKKTTFFYICFATIWFAFAAAYSVMALMGVQVNAVAALCPSFLCSCLYFDKIKQIYAKEK